MTSIRMIPASRSGAAFGSTTGKIPPFRVALLPTAFMTAASFAAILAGCGSGRSTDSASGRAAEGAGAARGDSAPGSGRIVLTGELRAVQAADVLMPPSDEWPIQIRWMIPEGTDVQEGEEILQFENSSVLSRLEEKKLAQIEAAIRLRSREGELDAERAEKSFALERARIDLEKRKIEAAIPPEMRSRREHEEKQIDLERALASLQAAKHDLAAFEVAAKASLDVLRLELAKADREITRAQRTLDGLSVKAPRSGVIIYGEHPWEGRKFAVSDNVWPGMPVVKIPELAAMEVAAWLSDVDDGRVAVGDETRCVLDTYPDRVFTGRVQDVSVLAEEVGRESGVRGFRVLLKLDSTDPSIMRPGMSVKAEVGRRPG